MILWFLWLFRLFAENEESLRMCRPIIEESASDKGAR